MPETIGQKLQQARQDRNLSLEQAAQATRVRLHYLRALEQDDLTALPSLAQGRGFLRSYAQYLGMDPAPLLEVMQPATKPVPPKKSPAPASLPISATDDTSQVILEEIGERLRIHRETLGLSLEDVERHTHLRDHYIEALESGRLEDLPSPVQARGMLHNYATFLGLDPDTVLLRFADALQARLASRQAAAAAFAAERSRVRPASPQPQAWILRMLPTDLIVTVLFIAAVIVFMIWGINRINSLQNQQMAESSPPAIVDVLTQSTPTGEQTLDSQASPTVTDSGQNPSSGELATETPTSIPPTLNPAPIQVYIVAQQRTWMRVIADGEIAFEGRVTVGTAYLYSAEQRVELTTGNAAALRVYFNRQDLGLLGIFGQVITRVYTRQGAETPTPTATPEGQLPPTSTPDLNATATPTLSPTARP
jgi:cytoskeletal protein RodZ